MKNTILIAIITTIALSSCNVQQKRLQKCEKWGVCKQQESVLIYDTIVQKADSVVVDNSALWSSILLECDSNGKVFIRQIDSLNAMNVQLETSLKENRLVQKIIVPGKTIYVPKYIRGKEVVKTVTKTTNELTKLQKILLWSGVILWLIIAIFVGAKMVKILRLFIV